MSAVRGRLAGVILAGALVLLGSCTLTPSGQPKAYETTSYQTSGAPDTEGVSPSTSSTASGSGVITKYAYPSGDPRISETYTCPLFAVTAVTDDGATYPLSGDCMDFLGGSAEMTIALPVGQHLHIEFAQPQPFTLSATPTGLLTVDGPIVTAVAPGVAMLSIHGVDCHTGAAAPPTVGCPLVQVTVTE